MFISDYLGLSWKTLLDNQLQKVEMKIYNHCVNYYCCSQCQRNHWNHLQPSIKTQTEE